MKINHLGTKTIETERLILRRFVIGDARAMFNNWANDAEVSRFLTWDAHENIEETESLLKNWIAEYENNNVYNWIIEWKNIGEAIGSISAISFNDKNLTCEIGYCIGKNFWSNGLTTEALKALLQFFFMEIGVNRIQAKHDVKNPASGRVMEKSGMVLEGTFRQAILRKDNSFGDINTWAILRNEYIY